MKTEAEIRTKIAQLEEAINTPKPDDSYSILQYHLNKIKNASAANTLEWVLGTGNDLLVY